MKNKKYKAIILDVDGTTIPNSRDGMPSPRVENAINKASEIVHVGIATGRPYFGVKHILKHLKLSGPSILSGGSQIIDAPTGKILWEQPLNKDDVEKVGTILLPFKPFFTDGKKDFTFGKENVPSKVLEMAIQSVSPKDAEKVVKEVSQIPTVVIHTVKSWDKGKIDVLITHALATKQHGIFEVAKILGIDTYDIIGVGDGGNDLPLLMACGLKVAMGNARDELKEIADYIAPSVDKDGVADVIEKFILNKHN
jgi:HAD superfamily hydrolase (TIGR01484 family)